ncbi:MAG: tellurite resistance/C4-dicarboxylate transporter family protein [Verrucomicrobia bacterium]|nr:tellurite resistance/C4-dicarboxylate transporter family protein [Verrucomicrobiota bacterium]
MTSLPHEGKPSFVEDFFPGYFALVMATGIVSLAMHLEGFPIFPEVLLWLNLIFYVVLWGITILRIAFFKSALISDLTHHARGVTFLTMVAGTGVLGVQFANLTSLIAVADGLWIFSVLLWLILIYTFFSAVTITEPKPSLDVAINGSWLLVTVSTESLSVLGTLVASSLTAETPILFESLCFYLLGAMFYILFIALILYRWIFLRMEPAKLTPPYWINMGALAITTLAGARLLICSQSVEMLHDFHNFIAGFTLFFWVTGTWWIPLLLIVGCWRHVVERVPLAYDPQYWSLVFPIGMYTVATSTLANAARMHFLLFIPHITVYFAMLAWLITFSAMLFKLVRFSFSARAPLHQ